MAVGTGGWPVLLLRDSGPSLLKSAAIMRLIFLGLGVAVGTTETFVLAATGCNAKADAPNTAARTDKTISFRLSIAETLFQINKLFLLISKPPS